MKSAYKLEDLPVGQIRGMFPDERTDFAATLIVYAIRETGNMERIPYAKLNDVLDRHSIPAQEFISMGLLELVNADLISRNGDDITVSANLLDMLAVYKKSPANPAL
jgi:hypothetical protein